jgi:hypothetical protein
MALISGDINNGRPLYGMRKTLGRNLAQRNLSENQHIGACQRRRTYHAP